MKSQASASLFPHAKKLFFLILLSYICLLSQGGISRDSKLIKTQKHIADKRHLGNWFRAALQHAETHPLSSHFVFFFITVTTLEKRKVGEKAKGKTKRERKEAFRLSRQEISCKLLQETPLGFSLAESCGQLLHH